MAPSGGGAAVDMTVAGNSTSGGAGFILMSSGTITLAGGNNITISQDGNAVTLSGAAAGGAQTAISGISASNTVYTSGTVDLVGSGGGITVGSDVGQKVVLSVAAPVSQTNQTANVIDMTLAGNTSGALALMSSGTVTLAGGNNITVSQAGNAVTISAANQSVQPETQVFIGGISASNTDYTSGTVRFTGVGGGVTVSSNTGQRVDISVAAQTNQAGSLFALSNTFGTSSGTYDARTLSIAGDGIVSVAASNSGFRISASQSVQTQSRFDMTLAGNSTSAGAGFIEMSSGTVTLAGGANITLSQNGNAVTISGAAGGTGGGSFSAGVSTGGNTAGSTGVTGTRLVLVGSNNITLSQSTDANGGTVSVNGPASSSLSGTGAVSLSTNGSTISIGVPLSIGGIVGSDATYTSGTVTFTGVGGGITVSSNTGQRIDLSVAAQSVQTQGILSAGVSTGGNTSGNTTVNSGSRLVFVGSNNITLSQGTAAGATTITISGGTAAGGSFSGGVSNLGNTAGATGITGTQLVLVGTNNITLSQTTDAGGATISISGASGGAGGNFSAGVSNIGQTSGSTGITGTRLVLAGVDPITLTQSTDANGATVSIDAPNYGTVSMWPVQARSTGLSAVNTSSIYFATAATRTTMTMAVFPMPVPSWLSADVIRLPVFVSISSASSNSTTAGTLGQSFGIYTLTGDTLSLLSSFSNQYQVSYQSTNQSTNASATWSMSYGSGTALSSSSTLSTNNAGVSTFWNFISNTKMIPFATGNLSLSPGQYFGVYAYSQTTAGNGGNFALQSVGMDQAASGFVRDIGLNPASVTWRYPLQGQVSATQTDTALPTSFLTADMTSTAAGVGVVDRVPAIQILSQF